jgi:hypothetical protein
MSMNGLRVYIHQKTAGTWCVDSIFYSRRGGGPYYRWRYEELRGCWLSSRVPAVELSVTELVSAPWKEVPAALKIRLDEHYVDY